MCQRATNGNQEDIQRLGKWSALMEQEAQVLRRRLRKQQHDFSTLFEIVGQTSARALDVVAMQVYLLRTVSGHFAAPKLLIMRRLRAEDHDLVCSEAQGMRVPECVLPIDSPICRLALERRYCFFMSEIPSRPPEVSALEELGMDLVVPLVQEVEGPGAVLEGMLLLGPRMAGQVYGDEDLDFLHVLGKMLAICLRNEALYRRSIIDDLTGVFSRGHFDAQLSQELNRIVTYGHRGLGLVMLDLDDFKSFNDRYGHQTGDRVLQELSRLLVRQVRNVDLVARYGGEEFVLILIEIDRAKVLEVAQRLCRAVSEMEVLSVQGEKLHITASFGLACFPDDALDKSTLIQIADEALYRSKAEGRNRVTAAPPGAGLKRELTLAPLPVGLPLQSVMGAAAFGRSERSDQPAIRHNHTALGGLPSPELDLIQQQRRALSGDGNGGAEEAVPAPPPQEERRRTALRSPDWARRQKETPGTSP
ncbi:MAG: GGDEF domain-containing protein [Planctomycetota bacterium]|nr:GGDEF domain-containing protein [Planctomycetota bacterium]